MPIIDLFLVRSNNRCFWPIIRPNLWPDTRAINASRNSNKYKPGNQKFMPSINDKTKLLKKTCKLKCRQCFRSLFVWYVWSGFGFNKPKIMNRILNSVRNWYLSRWLLQWWIHASEWWGLDSLLHLLKYFNSLLNCSILPTLLITLLQQ